MPRNNTIEDEDMEEDPDMQSDGFPYDPDQNRDEKRAVRKGYRALQDDDTLQNPAAVGIDDLTAKVRTADRLFERVKGPQEATLDSAFLVTASNLGAAKARQMRSDNSFDVDDLVAKLITFMGGRKQNEERRDGADDEDEIDDDGDSPLDWEKIGRRALAKSLRVPVMDFMLGPLSIEQKKRNAVRREKIDKTKEVETRPQELKEDDIQRAENETTKNVAALAGLLESVGRINLFRFVVNPESFGQSVENIFYLSFLIRDAKCVLEQSEEGEPIIYLCEPPTDEDYEEGLKKQQMVMEFDMDTWRRAIEVFGIKESKIPTRAAAETRLGDKWYG